MIRVYFYLSLPSSSYRKPSGGGGLFVQVNILVWVYLRIGSFQSLALSLTVGIKNDKFINLATKGKKFQNGYFASEIS